MKRSAIGGRPTEPLHPWGDAWADAAFWDRIYKLEHRYLGEQLRKGRKPKARWRAALRLFEEDQKSRDLTPDLVTTLHDADAPSPRSRRARRGSR
jgi:hypothetical protein